MRKAFSWFWRLGRDEAVIQVLMSSWFWLAAATVAAILLGILQRSPPLWTFLGVLGVVALVLVILAQNSIRRALSSPKFKIVVEAAQPHHWGEGDIQKVQGVLLIKNLGNFPIQVDASEVIWSMNGRTGEERVDILKTAIVSPLGQQLLRGPVFSRNWKQLEPGEVVKAMIDIHVKISYGKP